VSRAWLFALAACGGGKPAAVATEHVGPALVAAIAAADSAREPWRCAAADLPSLDAPAIPGWQAGEHGLTRAGDDFVVGVIADAGGAAPKTLAALGRLRAKMEAAHADAVIALGGMGSDERELEATLGVLAAPRADKPAWPVIALPGDLESQRAETAAIAALRSHGAIVIDGRLARWLVAGTATLATLPGAASPIDRSDGCAWTPADATRIYSGLSAKAGLRIALVAEAPRDDDQRGELALVPEPAIDLVVHGPVRPEPSAESHGGRDGARLRVSPGTSDATARLPETRAPAAGILAIHGTSWSWTPLVDR
jgi:hypothetical protein